MNAQQVAFTADNMEMSQTAASAVTSIVTGMAAPTSTVVSSMGGMDMGPTVCKISVRLVLVRGAWR
jgi:hypothetical protein